MARSLSRYGRAHPRSKSVPLRPQLEVLCKVGVGVWLDGFMRGNDATRRMGVQKVKEMIEGSRSFAANAQSGMVRSGRRV
jgi:hypothetical protein